MIWGYKKRLKALEHQLTEFMSLMTARMNSAEDALTEIEGRIEGEVQAHMDDLDLNSFLSEDTLAETIRDILADELSHATIKLPRV